MKKILLSILFLFPLLALSQKNKTEHLVHKAKREITEKYTFDTTLKYFIVESKFSSDSLISIDTEDMRILKADYVYTQFSESETFNQKELDKTRFKNFFENFPSIYENDLIKWNLVEQTGCKSGAECEGYFHGFVIYYQESPTEESMKAEIENIEKALEEIETIIEESSDTIKYAIHRYPHCSYPQQKKNTYQIAKKYKASFKGREKLKGKYNIRYVLDARGRITDIQIDNFKGGREEELKKILRKNLSFTPAAFSRKKYGGVVSGTIALPLHRKSLVFTGFEFPDYLTDTYEFKKTKGYKCSACKTDTVYRLGGNFWAHDKTVSSVLERNKTWNSNLIVVDVTGSMYPYTTDLLTWLKLNTIAEPKQFVFFNDGDNKGDGMKRVGKTGGIYSIRSANFDEVKATLIKAMTNGGGGDCPENNFEALLEGKKACPDCGDVVMIADNYAFPRDQELLKTYSGRLKIILCGTSYGINEEYLNLAKKYKFSIHTMRSDLTKLFELNEGQTIVIEGTKYIIKKGKFERVYGI